MRFIDLHWLPAFNAWRDEFSRVSQELTPSWHQLVSLANARLTFVETGKLNNLLLKKYDAQPPLGLPTKPIRLAIMSSSTTEHLLPGIRIAAMRRNIWLQTCLGDYGQYFQELLDEQSEIQRFKPDVLLFAFDAHHLLGDMNPMLPLKDAQTLAASAVDKMCSVWRIARERFGARIIQQTVINGFPNLVGNNEHRLPASPSSLVESINVLLRAKADVEGVDVLALDRQIAQDGLSAWHDPMLWHRAKQEISPVAGPAYGELLVRLIAAQQGQSYKCLALDLDNTLWGGVIGDDGVDGIKLGQGSAVGEAYVEFQRFVRDLGRRGIILAVCSKNDEANAKAPFASHPEMILKENDIACFVANWDDKPSNLRRIAQQLNIGIDAIAFADDNPFERNLVRTELPNVAVPELSEDPALYARCIADAGYFEASRITGEDLTRGEQYRANLLRETLQASHTDMRAYLKSLQMKLRWSRFDRVGLQRTVQLINKTNQFNLTTRRYSESEVVKLIDDPRALTLQLRLIDQFGDNGIISIVIGLPDRDTIQLDTWLMSCRVLGRQVEEEVLNLVVQEARRLGANRIIGRYLPTKKNAMVRDLYKKLGFTLLETSDEGNAIWELSLANYKPFSTAIDPIQV